MTEYLLDANLSPETASFLATEFGFGVVDLGSLRLASSTDDDVVVLAKRLHRVVITFDLDFGHLYHRDPGTFGVSSFALRIRRWNRSTAHSPASFARMRSVLPSKPHWWYSTRIGRVSYGRLESTLNYPFSATARRMK